MEVIVDGSTGFAPAEVPDDVMGMLAVIGTSLQTQGRAILAVKVDGQELSPARTVEVLSGKPLSSVGTLEVVSELTSKLVADCLAELESVLPDLSKACHELAAMFQGAEPHTGYEPFEQLADIWSHVKGRQELIAHTLGVALDTLKLDGKSVGALHTELNGFLAEAVGALESGDLILLGDLLEYELAPRADAEVRITALLRERTGG
jgi:hypothetical protein